MAIAHYNPGTVFDYTWKGQFGEVVTFDKWFWAFGPKIKGFRHCRPLISIDGTHLYGKYTGKHLVAVAYDADNKTVPLAFYLCDKESDDTWGWFLERLRKHVTKDKRPVCIMSDRHISIRNAIYKWYPLGVGSHRYCARHLLSNFNTHFKNIELKKEFGKMIWTSNKVVFAREYQQWYNADDGKYQHFNDRCGLFSVWSRAHDEGLRYENMTTNQAEVTNVVFKEARGLPITAILLRSFKKMNAYWIERSAEAETLISQNHNFPPKIRDLLKKVEDASKEFTATKYAYGRGRARYEVCSRTGCIYVVELEDKSCMCNEWTVVGRPCKHAVCAYRAANTGYIESVDRFFRVKKYKKTYSHGFHPLGPSDEWPVWTGPTVVADPRMLISGRGRKKTRIPNEMDERQPGAKRKCRFCRKEWHNTTTCPLKSGASSSGT